MHMELFFEGHLEIHHLHVSFILASGICHVSLFYYYTMLTYYHLNIIGIYTQAVAVHKSNDVFHLYPFPNEVRMIALAVLYQLLPTSILEPTVANEH